MLNMRFVEDADRVNRSRMNFLVEVRLDFPQVVVEAPIGTFLCAFMITSDENHAGPLAHSDPHGGPGEALADHLGDVAARAAAFGAAFGAAGAARAMGALHDVGKAELPFQAYLRGQGPSPDHSTAGAVLAVEKYGSHLGRLLAFGIAGHHAGLANGARPGAGLTPLRERLAGKAPLRLPPELDLAPSLADVKALGPLARPDGKPEVAFSFLARMLFSCLVDADFLETERFYAGRNGEPVERGCDLDVAALRDRLAAHLAGFDHHPESCQPINRLRARVLAAARDKAAQPPGLFTLTVPTGGGKTLASLAFALDHAVRHDLRRVIYVIPFTSIVEQTAGVFRTALGSGDAVLEHHSAYDPGARKAAGIDDEDRDGGRKLRLAAQNWDRPVVVTTAVQFFESLFANRTSRCRKLHNIARSVVVLDEAQTLPLPLLRPCLEALRELARGYGASVVLCTATQPALLADDGFPDGLKAVAEIAPDPKALYQELKRVTVTRLPDPLDDGALAARLAGEDQVLCIVNNRRHARDLYRRIADLPGARHLTTCLCAAHRREVLDAIRADLKDGRPVRLIATSLIEAGVDISFPTVYRATAGLDSIAQAAGRCNRNGELDGELGRVFVFDVADEETHRPPPELKQFAEVARGVLRHHAADPLGLDAVRAYFQELYWRRGEDELDAAQVGEGRHKGILKALREYAGGLDFPFADIAAAFRIIDSPLVPVIVPFRPAHDPGLVDRLLRDLAFVPLPGGIAARLQPYLVQVPPKARATLIAAGAAEVIRQDDFSDQFVRLTNAHLYHSDIGMDWEDPTFRRSELDIC